MTQLILAVAIGTYTNLAGNVVTGAPIGVSRHEVVLSNDVETVSLPMSIFPECERRRLAADFGSLIFIPKEVRDVVEGGRKAITRSMRRAELGLCTREEAESFVGKSRAKMEDYLKGKADSGEIMSKEAERLRGTVEGPY